MNPFKEWFNSFQLVVQVKDWLSFLKIIAITAAAGGLILYTVFSWFYTIISILT